MVDKPLDRSMIDLIRLLCDTKQIYPLSVRDSSLFQYKCYLEYGRFAFFQNLDRAMHNLVSSNIGLYARTLDIPDQLVVQSSWKVREWKG